MQSKSVKDKYFIGFRTVDFVFLGFLNQFWNAGFNGSNPLVGLKYQKIRIRYHKPESESDIINQNQNHYQNQIQNPKQNQNRNRNQNKFGIKIKIT